MVEAMAGELLRCLKRGVVPEELAGAHRLAGARLNANKRNRRVKLPYSRCKVILSICTPNQTQSQSDLTH